jgi:hypothetical protein
MVHPIHALKKIFLWSIPFMNNVFAILLMFIWTLFVSFGCCQSSFFGNFCFFFCPNFSLHHSITPLNFFLFHPKVLLFSNKIHGCKKYILITFAKKTNDEKCECCFIINDSILCFVCVFKGSPHPPPKNFRLRRKSSYFYTFLGSHKNHLYTWRFPYLWVLMRFKNTL